jgi:hypothetical protein
MDEKEKESKDDNVIKLKKPKKGKEQTLDVKDGNLGAKGKF